MRINIMPKIIPITDLTAPELKVFTTTAEVQLLRAFEPAPGMFIAESPKVIERALDAGYEPDSFLVETRYLKEFDDKDNDPGNDRPSPPHISHISEVIRRCEDIPVYTADQSVLEDLTGFHLTSGMVCAMHRRALPGVEEVCEGAERIALLEDITNPTNVGAIIRSAAALNMDAVLLTRACADPLYRRAIRVSMGTVFQIPWTIFDKRTSYPDEAATRLKDMGYKMAAMVLSPDSVSLDDERLMSEKKLVILLGAEGDGLKEDTVADCDYKVSIPMSHGVDSLNVAAASAVAFWQLGRR